MTTTATSDVFISYKAEDRARLTPLVSALEAEGFNVWWDAHIGGGTNWHEDIEQHLDSAKCVIVAWSKRSVSHEGHFVRDEARRAQRRDAYVPVCLDGVEPPLGFGEIQALSLKGWKGDRADPRFAAVADAVRSRITGEHHPHRPAHIAEGRMSRRAVMAGGAGAVALAGAGGWMLLKPAPANAKRIAVLPFASLSTDQEQAYFSEGVTEELRVALSRIGLEVIGRASSDVVKDLDTKAAALKLGVSNILSGSVRRSRDTIRINAHLVSGSDGVERWAESYDRAPGDAIKIQTDIASNVAQALSIALGQAGRAAIALGGTADSVAQDLYLRAVANYRTSDNPKMFFEAIALLDAAIARDPKYADAHVEKSAMLTGLGTNYPTSPADMANKLTQAETAAKQALILAPKLGTAHTALGEILQSTLDFAGALRSIRRALALSPNDPRVIKRSLNAIMLLGDTEEALRLNDRLTLLDPLNPGTYAYRAEILRILRRFPQSIEVAGKGIKLAPEGARDLFHDTIASDLALMNQPAKANAEYEKTGEPFRSWGQSIVAARSGDVAGAERSMARVRQQMGAAASYQYAQAYAQAGNTERAFAELENALKARDPGLVLLKKDPFLDPIRGDRRFAALLEKLNFP